MKTDFVDLADCTEAAAILSGSPARVARLAGWAVLLFLAAAMGWAYATPVKRVVVGAGRVRPAGAPLEGGDGASGHAVSAPAGGRVVAVGFREGQRVRRGEMLVRLDTAPLATEVERLERTRASDEEEGARLAALEGALAEQEAAALARVALEVAEADEGIGRERERRARETERAEAELRLAALALERARDHEARTRTLVEERLEARQRLAEAEQARREAEARHAAARRAAEPFDADVRLAERRRETAGAQAAVVRRDFAARREELRLRAEGKRGAVAAARASLDGLRREIALRTVVAPLDGVVTGGTLREGDVLEAGRSFAHIAPEAGFRMDATVVAADVAWLRVGMPARVKLDAYDYLQYGALTGAVEYLSPDAEVSEAGALVFRVRVRLDGTAVGRGERRGELKLGLTGPVEFVVGEERLATLLFQRVREKVRF